MATINYETKQPVVLVVDVSYSMEGKPIKEVQQGLEKFQQSLLSNYKTALQVELALVTFDNKATVQFDFAPPDQVTIPKLKCGPYTCLGGGVLKGIELIENRKKYYRETGQNYSRPILVLMTDGEPNMNKDILSFSMTTVHQMVEERKLLLWSFGVEEANMEFLQEFTPKTGGCLCKKLKEVEGKYLHFFRWLSNSISIVTAHIGNEEEIWKEIEEWMREEDDLFDIF